MISKIIRQSDWNSILYIRNDTNSLPNFSHRTDLSYLMMSNAFSLTWMLPEIVVYFLLRGKGTNLLVSKNKLIIKEHRYSRLCKRLTQIGMHQGWNQVSSQSLILSQLEQMPPTPTNPNITF